MCEDAPVSAGQIERLALLISSLIRRTVSSFSSFSSTDSESDCSEDSTALSASSAI
jgi:hypothetical protein